MIIKIDKKRPYVFIIEIMLFLLLFQGFFIDLGCTTNIKYLLDILNIFLFLFVLNKNYKCNDDKKNVKFIVVLYGAMIGLGLCSTIFNIFNYRFNIINIVLDLRNYIRFPMFFISCKLLLKEKDYLKIYNNLIWYQLINTVAIIYQYFTVTVFDYWMRGDYLNGFFGTRRGGNLFVNVLMVIVLIFCLNQFLTKKMDGKKFGFIVGTCLLDATLIELKFFYIEFVLCFLLMYFFHGKFKNLTCKKIKKGAIIIGAACVGLFVLIEILYKIYPWMQGSMSITQMISNAISSEGYTGNGDFNRLNAVSGVFRVCFKGNIFRGLFGIGIGNAYSGGATLSAFAKKFSYTNYTWFQSSYVFSEVGLIGLLLYISTFILIFLKSKNSKYSDIVKTMVLISLSLIIYDEVLKTEAAYLVYLTLSFYFMEKRVSNDGKCNIECNNSNI